MGESGIRARVRGRGPRRVVGVDTGERCTRVVVLEGSAAEPRVVGWAEEPTPAGLVVSGRAPRPDELAAWLRRVLRHARPGDRVWMACPWADAQVKRLSVPDAGNREATLRGLAVNPAFRTGAGDTGGWRLDYHVVDAAAGVVMAVAARPESVRTLALAVAAAGGELGGVGVAESALVHAWLGSAPSATSAVLVEAGHGGVTLVVTQGGEPVGFRRVMFGGRALEERGGWDLPSEAPPPLVEEWSARIAQEVRMLAGAAFRGTGGGTPEVVVMGGLARSEGLVAGLRSALGGVVERWKGPVAAEEAGEAAGDDAKAGGSGMALAFGLARQGLAAEADGTGGPALQLLRDADASRVRGATAAPGALARDGGVRLALAACVGVALACGASEAWLGRATREAGTALVQSQVDSARVQGDIGRVARLQAERARLGGAGDAVERIRGGAQAWPRLMDRVARAMPQNAWADSLAMDTTRDAGAGVAFRLTGYAGTAGQVAALERALRGSGVVETGVVSLAPASVAGLTLVRWTLVGRIAESPLPLSAGAGYGPGEHTEPGESRR